LKKSDHQYTLKEQINSTEKSSRDLKFLDFITKCYKIRWL